MVSYWVSVRKVITKAVEVEDLAFPDSTTIEKKTTILHEDFQVHEIRDSKICQRRYSSLFGRYVFEFFDYDDVEGIALTEKTLELFGFDKNGHFENDDIKIDCSFYDGYNVSLDTKFRHLDTVVWSVHDFQNALKVVDMHDLVRNMMIAGRRCEIFGEEEIPEKKND